jgi:DNA-binding NarL/FixJ family response regulator
MSHPQAEAASGSRPKVFVAEDLPDAHDSIATLLALAGYELAGSARTEQEAAAWLAANEGNWHLAVIDLVLAEGSGLALVARFARASLAPMVIYTAYASAKLNATCQRLGAAAVFSKLEGPQLAAYARALLDPKR